MSKHTKGPWAIEGNGGRHVTIYAQKNSCVADAWWINLPEQEGIANAHLIAAAPDLLEALQLSVKLYEQYGLVAGAPVDDESAGSWVNKARAAIAKATQ